MAKDGTLRGMNATGRPAKSVLEKAEAGNPGKRRLKVLDVPDNLTGEELEGADMPPPEEYMASEQKDGKPLKAVEIYEKTYNWLKKLGMEQYVNTQLINQYAMSVSRWIQCEEAVSKFGFLGLHPTAKTPIQSPYVAMSQSYMKQTNVAWMQIYQIIKENCTTDFRGPNPQDDTMELLLRARGGGK